MKLMIIYSNDCKDEVEQLRTEISNKYDKSTILRMNSLKRKKQCVIPHCWHYNAIKLIKSADMIVYFLSQGSIDNENVNWELKYAIKQNKYIVCLGSKTGNIDKINKCLNEKRYEIDFLNSKKELFNIIDEFNNNSYIPLFNDNQDKKILFEQYKLFSETAENLVSRRQNVNSFYFSTNAALITISATIFALGNDADLIRKLLVTFALAFPGILLNYSWRKLLQSYYINHKGKLKILSMIEKELAVSLYDAEWKAMKNKYSKQKYVSFTDNEKILPVLFIFIYIGVALACFIGLLLYL